METSTLSPKNQITIPKSIRKKVSLQQGQKFTIEEKEGKIELTPILTPEQLFGYFKGDTPLVFEREEDREL